jgi:hypothetical protein
MVQKYSLTRLAMGVAPAILKFSAGKHSIQLVRQSFKDWTSERSGRENSIVNVSAKLET